MVTPNDSAFLYDSRVQSHFDHNADLYVDKTREVYRISVMERFDLLCSVLHIDQNQPIRLLDVGCGGGMFLDLFLDHFSKATAYGVDISEGMLLHNSPSNRKHLVQGDALNLPTNLGEFDVINVDAVMHHLISTKGYGRTIDQITHFLRSLGSLLAPGGTILIREIYHEYTGLQSFGSRAIYTASTLRVPSKVEGLLKSAGIQTANAGVCFLPRARWRQVFDQAGYNIAGWQDRPWPGQPYRKFGFSLSGDVHFLLRRLRPLI